MVETDDHTALLEISGDRGHPLDFVPLPHDALASAADRVSRAAS